MSRFKVGDTVFVEKKDRSMYKSSTIFEAFPMAINQTKQKVLKVEPQLNEGYYYLVSGAYHLVLEFELSPVVVEDEAEWE